MIVYVIIFFLLGVYDIDVFSVKSEIKNVYFSFGWFIKAFQKKLIKYLSFKPNKRQIIDEVKNCNISLIYLVNPFGRDFKLNSRVSFK